jgi:hypothetical protein
VQARDVVIAALALAAATAAAASDAPLSVRTPGTLRDLFLDPTISDARPLQRPELDVRWTASNTWSTPTELRRGDTVVLVQTDAQSDSLTLSFRAPWAIVPGLPEWLASRGSTAIEWRLATHWGGWTDPVISTWHRVIRVYDYQRDGFPRDAVRIRLGAAGAAPAVDVEGTRVAPGDLVLRSQLTLARGGAAADGARDRWAVATRLDLKFPTGSVSAAGGSGGFDGAAALLATYEVTRWFTAHGMAAVTRVSPLPAGAGLQPRPWQYTGEVSLALRAGAWAFLVEDRVSSSLLEAGWTFPGTQAQRRSSAYAASFRAQNQLSFGVRRGPLTFWFSEDFTPGDEDPVQGWYYLSNAPDFALGLTWRSAL